LITVAKSDAELEARLKKSEDEFRSSSGRKTDPGSPRRHASDNHEEHEDEENEPAVRAHERKQAEIRGRAFIAFCRRGVGGLNEEAIKALGGVRSMGQDERSAHDPLVENRNLTVGTGSAGGFTVSPLFQSVMSDAMKAFQGVREAGSEHITGDSGADLPFPNNNDTAAVATIVAETAAQSTNTTAFGQTVIPTYMYSSGIVLCSIQLLQDSAFNIEGWLQGKLMERMGRGTNLHWTTGTGSSQPNGIVTAMGTSGAGIGVTTALNNAITADEVLNLQHSVDIGYRRSGKCKYAFSDGILNRLRILKDSQGRYLLNEPTQAAPGTIWGQPYEIFTEMSATITASTNLMLFGDFSNYKTREVRGMTLFRFNELYMVNGQVGFCVFGRFGGNFVNPGNFPVKAMRTAA